MVVVELTGAGANLPQDVLTRFELSEETDFTSGLTVEELDWIQIRLDKLAVRAVADEQVG
jgi:hypothetical protein